MRTNTYAYAKLLVFYSRVFSALSFCIKFVHEEALAYELAAYLYLELGEINKSVEYFLLAHERYKQWGASEKAESLFKFAESIVQYSGVYQCWRWSLDR